MLCDWLACTITKGFENAGSDFIFNPFCVLIPLLHNRPDPLNELLISIGLVEGSELNQAVRFIATIAFDHILIRFRLNLGQGFIFDDGNCIDHSVIGLSGAGRAI